MPYFTSSGTSIYYETEGIGLPLIFIHPPAMGLSTFQKQWALSNKYQVIMMDARGHGKSDVGQKRSLSISEWAGDVKALCDHLQVRKVALCGYSSGASVALEFALNWPERTAGVVLSGGFPSVETILLKNQFELGIRITRNEWMPFLAWVLSLSHTRDPLHQQAIRESVLNSDPQLVASLYENGLMYNCKEDLPRIKSPLLLIYGMTDYYIHYYEYPFYKYIPKGLVESVRIDGVAHQIPTRKPNEYNRVIEQFVNKIISTANDDYQVTPMKSYVSVTGNTMQG